MASIYQNMIDNLTFPVAKPGRAVSIAQREIAAQPYVKLKTANVAISESTVIATFGGSATSGNFTLTVNAPVVGVTYTTANIVYNASAATIVTALDTASPTAIADGDVGVTAGSANFTDGNMTFDCVDTLGDTPVLITIADVDLTGTAPTVGAVTRTTDGHADRNCYQALYEMNIVIGAGNDAGESPSMTLPDVADYIGRPERPRLEVIEWLATQMPLEEGTNNTRNLIRTLYDLPEALFGPN